MPNPSGAVADFDGIPEFISARLSGIALTQPEDGSVDDPFTLTSDSVSIGLLEFHDPFMVARPNTLMMSLDWEGPYSANDLDLYVFNSSGLFESSESGSRFEGDFFNNPANENHPDGDYIVEVAIWTSVDENPIPYRLVFTHPDGSRDIHEGTVDPAIGFVDPVMITQTTDAEGNRTFVTTAL